MESGVRMIGSSGASAATERAIEAFEAAGGAEVGELPRGVAFVDGKVGEGGAEVGAEATDGFGLGGAIAAHDTEQTAQGGRALFGLPDVVKVPKDRLALAALLFVGEGIIGDSNGVVEIAQLVKETTLLGSAKVDDVECGAEA